MRNFERIITDWNVKEPLDLSYSDIKYHKDIPKNVKELDISGTQLYINYLPTSLRKLTYHEYPYNNVEIILNNIEYLDLSYSHFETIIKLPNNLKTLILKSCRNLSVIKELPSSLETLVISKASFLKLEDLPASIKELTLEECNLKEIKRLPVSLQKFNCSYNYLEYLPDLPSTLTKLECDVNALTVLPELPSSLTTLKCSNNKITNIFDFPPQLKSLNISYNNIGVLLYLPSNLKKLHCVSCGLLTLPELPKTLTLLHCGKNKLILLPELPSSLLDLEINDNPITNITIPRKLKTLNINNCKLKNLPTIPATLKELMCDGIPLRKITQDLNNIVYLTVNNTELEVLPSLWDGLEYLECSNNFLSKLPALPKTLEHLACAYNTISKLPKLPASLIELDCSHNRLTDFPKTDTLETLDISYNLLSALSSIKNIQYLNISYNKLTSLEGLPDTLYNLDASFNNISKETEIKNIPRKIKMVNLEGNPVYDKIKPEIRTPFFTYETRYFKNEKVNITTIPKGTVLFKGFADSSRIISDYTGWYKSEDKYSYVWPNFNVFSYPYPFVVDDINLVGVNITMVTSVLQNDVKVVLGVLPSTNARDDRHNSDYLRSCDTLEVSQHFKGLHYDPCFNPDFMIQNKDVIGSIFISGTDAEAHNIVSGKNLNLLKYRHFFQDKMNHIGVPEIVLYPFKKRYFEEVKFERDNNDLYNILKENIDLYNYRPISIDPHIASKESEFKTLVDKLLSPEGAFIDGKQMHMTIDRITNFFVIAELVDKNILDRCIPIEEKNKLKYLK